jgi:hypothetical protein
LNKTGWSGVESAMEWLLNHPEGEDDEEDEEGQAHDLFSRIFPIPNLRIFSTKYYVIFVFIFS